MIRGIQENHSGNIVKSLNASASGVGNGLTGLFFISTGFAISTIGFATIGAEADAGFGLTGIEEGVGIIDLFGCLEGSADGVILGMVLLL